MLLYAKGNVSQTIGLIVRKQFRSTFHTADPPQQIPTRASMKSQFSIMMKIVSGIPRQFKIVPLIVSVSYSKLID